MWRRRDIPRNGTELARAEACSVSGARGGSRATEHGAGGVTGGAPARA